MELPKVDFAKELDGDAIVYKAPRTQFSDGQVIGRENLPRQQDCALANDITKALIADKKGPYARLDGIKVHWLACTHKPGEQRRMSPPKESGYPSSFLICPAWFRGHANADVIGIVHAQSWDVWQREGQEQMMVRAVASVLARLFITDTGLLKAYRGATLDPPELVRMFGPSNLSATMEFIDAFNEWQASNQPDLSVAEGLVDVEQAA